MAVLISPSNNTGWGLGVRGMFGSGRRLTGGARERSDDYPVLVRQHYRAPWGAISRGRRAAAAAAALARRRRRRPRIPVRGSVFTRVFRRRRGLRGHRRRRRALAIAGPGPALAIEAPAAAPAGPRRSARISSRRARGLVATYHPSITITRGYRGRRARRRAAAAAAATAASTPIIEEVE